MIGMPPRGSHIYSDRIGYTHHGIYVGMGCVVHHSGFAEAFKKGEIDITSLDEFCAGNGYKVRKYSGRTLTADEIVQRAYDGYLEGSEYNLVFNNCEHFATWCVTGQRSSQQVKNVVAGSAALIPELITPLLMRSGAVSVAGVGGKTLLAASSFAASTTPLAAAVLPAMAGLLIYKAFKHTRKS